MATTKYIVDNLSGQTINGEPILRPYKVYTALLNTTDGVPEAIVLENTIGNIVWTHHPIFGDGFYLATLANAFLDKDKLFTLTDLGSSTGDYSPIQWFDVNSLLLENKNMSTNAGVENFSYRRIEIRVYN
jgi:hypothetical protein